MQDNVIDATPYFLEENESQALGERRIGLGVMGLADLMIYTHNRYGSAEGNVIIDKVLKQSQFQLMKNLLSLRKKKEASHS